MTHRKLAQYAQFELIYDESLLFLGLMRGAIIGFLHQIVYPLPTLLNVPIKNGGDFLITPVRMRWL